METVAQSLTFAQALLEAKVRARNVYGTEMYKRISCAMALVTEGYVRVGPDAQTWYVTSQKDPDVQYTVNGHCTCKDVEYNHPPEGLCKHRLSVYLYRRALQLTQEPLVTPEPDTTATAGDSVMAGEAEPVAPHGIAPRFLKIILGKPYVLYAGLLAMAHERGLVSLKARFISVTAELALAEAEAIFSDGRTFAEAGDATPENVHFSVRPHFARVALTRAKSRTLRDALNIGICAVEELE